MFPLIYRRRKVTKKLLNVSAVNTISTLRGEKVYGSLENSWSLINTFDQKTSENR